MEHRTPPRPGSGPQPGTSRDSRRPAVRSTPLLRISSGGPLVPGLVAFRPPRPILS
jgi:hypothetical protein